VLRRLAYTVFLPQLVAQADRANAYDEEAASDSSAVPTSAETATNIIFSSGSTAIAPQSVEYLLLGDRDLTVAPLAVLNLVGAHGATNAWLNAVVGAGRANALTVIDLHGCAALDEDALCRLVAHTPGVRTCSVPYVARCGARSLAAMGRCEQTTLGRVCVPAVAISSLISQSTTSCHCVCHSYPCRFPSGWSQLEYLDITSCAAVNDAALEALVAAAATHHAADRHPLRYFNCANIGTVTDRGLKAIGRYFALQDLCLYGCYRVTDNGVLDLRVESLRRFNFSGCYKITSGCQRYLFTSNTNILFYNQPHHFGSTHPIMGKDGPGGKRGGR
jgi:hypothetical protein